MLTEFVAHDAADGGLWAQSTTVGETAFGKGTLLMSLLLRLDLDVVTGALGSVSLFSQKET